MYLLTTRDWKRINGSHTAGLKPVVFLARFPTTGVELPVTGVEPLATGVELLVSGVELPATDVWLLATGVDLRKPENRG
jgi:hypothetical protein